MNDYSAIVCPVTKGRGCAEPHVDSFLTARTFEIDSQRNIQVVRKVIFVSRTTTRTLGAIVGGLLAAAFLPVGVAVADVNEGGGTPPGASSSVVKTTQPADPPHKRPCEPILS